MKQKAVWVVLALLACLALPGRAEAIGGDFTVTNGVLTKYNGAGGAVVIPEEYNGQTIVEIGDGVFRPETNTESKVTSVTVPKTVKRIGRNAFANCKNLAQITLAEGLEEIGSAAFSSCIGLKSVSIPDSVTTLGTGVFESSGLNSVRLPNGISEIPESFFSWCTDLERFTLPGTVTSIGESAFAFSGLRSITFSTGVKTIGNYAFQWCASLTAVTLPEGLQTLGLYAFERCTALTEAEIPGSLKDLPGNAFAHCTALRTVVLRDGLESIGSNAFCECENLTGLKIPDTVRRYGGNAFEDCKSLTEIYVPVGTKSGDQMYWRGAGGLFRGCRNLRTAVIGEGAELIPGKMFASCENLKTVTIPGTVKAINANAFYHCDALEKVIFGGSEAEWYAIPDTEGNEILTALTQAGKVEYTRSAAGTWDSALGWRYNVKTGNLSYTDSRPGTTLSPTVYAAAYRGGRLLSCGVLGTTGDSFAVPSGADTVKLFDVNGSDYGNRPNRPACVITRSQLEG